MSLLVVWLFPVLVPVLSAFRHMSLVAEPSDRLMTEKDKECNEKDIEPPACTC
jgi:hypothetical protein